MSVPISARMSCLREDVLGGAAVDAGDLVQQRQRRLLLQRAHRRLDAFVQLGDLPLVVLHLVQQQPQA